MCVCVCVYVGKCVFACLNVYINQHISPTTFQCSPTLRDSTRTAIHPIHMFPNLLHWCPASLASWLCAHLHSHKVTCSRYLQSFLSSHSDVQHLPIFTQAPNIPLPTPRVRSMHFTEPGSFAPVTSSESDMQTIFNHPYILLQ